MDIRNERGQSLIQMALVLVVLLGIAALAIDIGHAYVVRRQMQNAADASALAGAYAMCRLQPENEVIDLAEEYLTRNNVAAGAITDESVTIVGGMVNVRADASTATFLAGALGFSVMDIAAEAGAACGAASAACSPWPIAIDREMWAAAECGETIIIWNSLNENKLEDSCKINGKVRPLCDCYKCDRNGDGIDDFRFATEDSRAWLDLANVMEPLNLGDPPPQSNGCGASTLKDLIDGDITGRVPLPVCIAGLSGVKASALKNINAGRVVNVPLYSSKGCTSDSKCGHETFYVENFGCMSIVEVDTKFTLYPKPGFPSIKALKNFMVIFASKVCGDGCTTTCGGTNGSMPADWELRAVNMVR